MQDFFTILEKKSFVFNDSVSEKLFEESNHFNNTQDENELDDCNTNENLSEIFNFFHSFSLLQCFSHQSVHKNESFNTNRRVHQ